MRQFLDTSVLVAAFLGDHENHDASLDVFLRLGRKEGFCAAHSIAEVYGTVTRLPGKHRVSGEHALLFLEDVRKRLSVVALDEAEYFDVAARAAATGLAGGAIYDALIGRCAVKARVATLFTWNVKHFTTLDLPVAIAVQTPLGRA